MNAAQIKKYAYRVRSRNGVIVENLLIAGRDEDDTIRKLKQMYPHCEILESKSVTPERITTSYEEVLDLITNHP